MIGRCSLHEGLWGAVNLIDAPADDAGRGPRSPSTMEDLDGGGLEWHRRAFRMR
jgi:hypothetical protein